MTLYPRKDAGTLWGVPGVGESNTRPKSTAVPTPPKPPAHHNAPAGTSDVAADRIAPHAPNLRSQILAFIRSRGPAGATDDEGERALDIRCQTYTPRRGELRELGLVIDSGRRRPTETGRPAAVWVAVEHAQRTEGAETGGVV